MFRKVVGMSIVTDSVQSLNELYNLQLWKLKYVESVARSVGGVLISLPWAVVP